LTPTRSGDLAQAKEKKRLYLTENLSNAASCRGGQY